VLILLFQIWSTQTLQPLSIIHPYHESDAGDLFCLTYSLDLDTLFIGCQNASIQWIDLSTQSQHRPAHLLNIQRRYHKFFDSFPQIDRRPPGEDSPNATASPTSETTTGEQDIKVLHIPATQVFDYAHYGYIYCMTIHSSNQGDSAILQLITGSGDETIKVKLCVSFIFRQF
jgi:di- and tripeptidase